MSIDWPSCTRAALPVGFPKARLIPSWRRSAPAVAIILFSLRIIWDKRTTAIGSLSRRTCRREPCWRKLEPTLGRYDESGHSLWTQDEPFGQNESRDPPC